MVGEKEFRQDLLYRINTVEIIIPPLRERLEDIPFLADHFLQKFAKKYNKPNSFIRQEGIEKLQAYNWPGNIRELEHTLERFVIMADAPEITVDQLGKLDDSTDEMPKNLNLEDMEKIPC